MYTTQRQMCVTMKTCIMTSHVLHIDLAKAEKGLPSPIALFSLYRLKSDMVPDIDKKLHKT